MTITYTVYELVRGDEVLLSIPRAAVYALAAGLALFIVLRRREKRRAP